MPHCNCNPNNPPHFWCGWCGWYDSERSRFIHHDSCVCGFGNQYAMSKEELRRINDANGYAGKELCPNCGGGLDLVADCKTCGGEGLVDIISDIPNEQWRQMGQYEQSHLLSWVGEGVNKQLKKGQDRYRSHVTGFKGDPWEYAVEEAFDLLVYLYMEGRKQGKV